MGGEGGGGVARFALATPTPHKYFYLIKSNNIDFI